VLQQSTPPVTCPGTAATIISGLGPSFHTALLDNQVNQDLYSAYLAGVSLQPDALASWERSHAAAATQSCTSVIEVATDKVALKIEKAVINGASFATEATTYSQNSGTGSGGAVGCVLESQWTGDLGPVVGALTVGVVSKPVKYQSSWLLFDVTKRQLEPTTDVVPQIDSLESSAFNVQYSKALVAADISVSPVYGSVQRKAVQGGYSLAVVPPSSKACVYALSATAAGCVSTPTATTGSSG
jgi:parvulin-like peptidyl-prolyl isomerase